MLLILLCLVLLDLYVLVLVRVVLFIVPVVIPVLVGLVVGLAVGLAGLVVLVLVLVHKLQGERTPLRGPVGSSTTFARRNWSHCATQRGSSKYTAPKIAQDVFRMVQRWHKIALRWLTACTRLL